MESSPIRTPIHDLGEAIDQVNVQIGPRFLELFSEQLYSSPNKAFEELVSNSWDAGATVVHVRIPEHLADDAAAVWVLDNGESMDLEGLRLLWAVATSLKRSRPQTSGRAQIGKFGIGKLATYSLANQLTHICKAKDGLIRAVSMDYRVIDTKSEQTLHIDPVPLDIRQLALDDVKHLLRSFADGERILQLIMENLPPPPPSDYEDEYGLLESLPPAPAGTWTLAIMTSLKPAGQRMQYGWIRRLLRTSLPLGSSIAVVLNDTPLYSAKIDKQLSREWVLGKDSGLTTIEVTEGKLLHVSELTEPNPHITLEGIEGAITGRIRLYGERISGGKSEALGPSNGFFVNIRGRVVNTLDPYFGLENLNHAAWAKTRITIRADFLDDHLGVNREDLKHDPQTTAFRALLRACFNKARLAHDAIVQASWPSAGDVLAESWSIVPVEPLTRVITETAGSAAGLPEFVEPPSEFDASEFVAQWEATTKADPGSVIERVEFRSLNPDAPLFRYDLSSRTILINSSHPFALEHLSADEAKVVRDSAVASLLTDAYMVDQGIDVGDLRQAWQYRDQILRLVARVNRRSGPQIAQLLTESTSHIRGFERIVGDALDYVGFAVQRLGDSGQPEGVATAPLPPDLASTSLDHSPTKYSFTYDAKSTSLAKVKTSNLGIAALARHRQDWNADHTLVVAPDFQVAEALLQECEASKVTPMRARDLARLVMISATSGPIDLRAFRSLFELHDPNRVEDWIDDLASIRSAEQRPSLAEVLEILAQIGFDSPNSIHVSVVCDRLSQKLPARAVKARDIHDLFKGLQVLIPSLIRTAPDGNVYISSSPQKIREAILLQLEPLPEDLKFGAQKGLKAGPSEEWQLDTSR